MFVETFKVRWRKGKSIWILILLLILIYIFIKFITPKEDNQVLSKQSTSSKNTGKIEENYEKQHANLKHINSQLLEKNNEIGNLKTTTNYVKPDDSSMHGDSHTGITYTNIKPFLFSKPDTDDVLRTHPPQFLKDVQNPCFAFTESYINVGNITLSYALEKGYEIRCLPYAYQAGFTKSGTGDIFHKCAHHKLFSGFCPYIKYQIYKGLSPGKYCVGKESHFWDNMYCNPNYTFNHYTKMFPVHNIANTVFDNRTLPRLTYNYRNMVFLDATPRVIWHGDTWHEDKLNQGLDAPDILLPHKIHHVNPNTKFIVTMRNPTSRLFSDYKFYYHQSNRSAVDFHDKVVAAIAWWKKCIAQYPVRTCAYGKAPPGLPELGDERCMKNKTDTYYRRMHNKGVCHSIYGWTLNTAERLRVSMYDLYLSDWFKIFPRENFHFIKFEDYIADPMNYIKNNILKFLNLPPLTSEEEEVLSENDSVKNQSKSTLAMLPETKRILDEFYKGTQNALYELLKDDRFLWIK